MGVMMFLVHPLNDTDNFTFCMLYSLPSYRLYSLWLPAEWNDTKGEGWSGVGCEVAKVVKMAKR